MTDRVAKRPRVGPSEAEEEAMMKALLEGLTPSDFDMTPDCSQATPPRTTSERSKNAKSPFRSPTAVTLSPTSDLGKTHRGLTKTCRTMETRHVNVKLSPKRALSPRKSTATAGTDHMSLLGLSQKAKVAASGDKRAKSNRIASPKRKLGTTLKPSLEREPTQFQPLSSSTIHNLDTFARVDAEDIKIEPPKTPIRDRSATPPPKPLPSTPVIDDVCLPPPSQESMYDGDWDLGALADMDESELIKPVVKVGCTRKLENLTLADQVPTTSPSASLSARRLYSNTLDQVHRAERSRRDSGGSRRRGAAEHFSCPVARSEDSLRKTVGCPTQGPMGQYQHR